MTTRVFQFRATNRDLTAITTIQRLWPQTPGIDPLSLTEAVQIALADLAQHMHETEHRKTETTAGNKCHICNILHAGNYTKPTLRPINS